MKKISALLIVSALVLSLFSVSCATKKATVVTETNVSDTKWVTAVFAKEDAQAYTEADGDKEKLDTIWIYYSDGTFEQFVELDDEIALFSMGTYALTEGGDFVFEDNESVVNITIRRSHKFRGGLLEEYLSEHTYDLGSLGFDQLYAYENDSKRVEAVFYGHEKQPFVESDGEREMLDTVWIYFSDMTFEQYAWIDDVMVLFSTGTYVFADGGDFLYESQEENFGDIVISRKEKYQAGKGLSSHESTHTYDLNSLGFVVLVVPGK